MDSSVLDEIKHKQWKSWFDDPIPLLENLSPRQAAKTPNGRALLNELFGFYDSMRTGDFLDCNVPTGYAKWKLNMGPGSAEEFAVEEAILNYQDPRQATVRKERHDKRLNKKKRYIFIPKRCEVPGCTTTEGVRACNACQCVWYCGKDHQVRDWPRHKLDCKALKKKSDWLHPKAFTTQNELAKYPLGCFPVENKHPDTVTLKCFVCHATPSEVNLGFTPCCNMPICDNEFEYEICSYSRDYCMRSHMRYTMCYTHHEEKHEGDWRECEQCNANDDKARPFSTTNGFNVTPALEFSIPQGSFITRPCASCKNRILPGHDGSTFTTRSDGTQKEVCSDCATAEH